jgi:hypothetical protein
MRMMAYSEVEANWHYMIGGHFSQQEEARSVRREA